MDFEGDDYYGDNFDDNGMGDFDGPPGMNFNNRKNSNNVPFYQSRYSNYNNAFGNYKGGYGPPGGFGSNWRGPPTNYGPPDNFGPPPPPPLFPPYTPEPPGPSGFMWGRGFGPTGPPVRNKASEEKTLRYLMKCGVSKDNLKNLPKDLLEMYEPEYCGLCAHGFDNYAVSRLHYISKNHLKNQKKWLSQQDGNRRNKKEIPLKSRDLYCELCDVHITSKTHSNSHYSGKPHRAIVEGRKNPRNPFLLQSGMENRIEQLIRREKKFVKSCEDEVPTVEAAAEKLVQGSELYCDICKTSVTCTEQMTMHLNGKRHLNKEKHHILNMMTRDHDGAAEGGVEEGAEAPANSAPLEGGGDTNNETMTTTVDDDNNDDWANGSGTWDEPNKPEQ